MAGYRQPQCGIRFGRLGPTSLRPTRRSDKTEAKVQNSSLPFRAGSARANQHPA